MLVKPLQDLDALMLPRHFSYFDALASWFLVPSRPLVSHLPVPPWCLARTGDRTSSQMLQPESWSSSLCVEGVIQDDLVCTIDNTLCVVRRAWRQKQGVRSHSYLPRCAACSKEDCYDVSTSKHRTSSSSSIALSAKMMIYRQVQVRSLQACPVSQYRTRVLRQTCVRSLVPVSTSARA